MSKLLPTLVFVVIAASVVWWAISLSWGGALLWAGALLAAAMCIRGCIRCVMAMVSRRRITAKWWLLFTLMIAALVVIVKTAWLWLSASSYSYPPAKEELLGRRAYLLQRVLDPEFGPNDMPGILPEVFKQEWAIGTMSMAASAVTNVAFRIPETAPSGREAVGKLLARMLEPDIRSYEDHYWQEDAIESLPGDNGHAGYLGHLNLMFGAYRLLGGDCRHEKLHAAVGDALARRLEKSAGKHIETFPGQIFVPDNMVVYASLALRTQTGGADYSELFRQWRSYTETNLLDPATGLIVTWLRHDGRPDGGSRGSYAGWNSFFLPFFDPEFAAAQYGRLQQHLVVRLPFGMAGVREYLPGAAGGADVDSGPIVFGLSTSGSGFAVAGALHAKDGEVYRGLLKLAEAVGSTVNTGGRRHYLAAPLIGEAIMLAMKSAARWDARYVRRCGDA